VSENKPTREHWLSTDRALDAVNSLEMVYEQLAKTNRDPHRWKWVLIALHNALQAYMVLALRGSDGLNVLTDKLAKEQVDAWKQNSKILRPLRLDDFGNLYKKIQKRKLMLRGTSSKVFVPQGTQDESVELLQELRNDFIHFVHGGLAIKLIGLPRVVKDCIDIIDFLAFKCGNVLWYDDTLEARTKELIEQIRLQLQNVN
jgi:hypothetical protein